MADRVRTADPHDEADLAVLTALRRAWTEEDAGAPVADDGFDEAFAGWARTEPRTFFVVERADVAVGSLNVLEYRRMPAPGRPAGRWGYLANVFVLPDHRGGGLGSLLLARAVAHCAERGHVRVVLSPSPRSVALYARAGFVPAEELMVLSGGALQRRPALAGD